MVKEVKNIGKVAIVYKDEWNKDTTYDYLDVVYVESDRTSYVSLVDGNRGNEPKTMTDEWGVLIKAQYMVGEQDLYDVVNEILTTRDNSIKGKIDMADKWTKPIKINGVDVDGTKDVTITAMPSNDVNLVHKNGDEDIYGSKFFIEPIYGSLKTKELDNGTDMYKFVPTESGYYFVTTETSKTLVNSPFPNSGFHLKVSASGLSNPYYVDLEATEYNTGKLLIATNSNTDYNNPVNSSTWAPAGADESGLVHLEGAETITGGKTYTAKQNFNKGVMIGNSSEIGENNDNIYPMNIGIPKPVSDNGIDYVISPIVVNPNISGQSRLDATMGVQSGGTLILGGGEASESMIGAMISNNTPSTISDKGDNEQAILVADENLYLGSNYQNGGNTGNWIKLDTRGVTTFPGDVVANVQGNTTGITAVSTSSLKVKTVKRIAVNQLNDFTNTSVQRNYLIDNASTLTDIPLMVDNGASMKITSNISSATIELIYNEVLWIGTLPSKTGTIKWIDGGVVPTDYVTRVEKPAKSAVNTLAVDTDTALNATSMQNINTYLTPLVGNTSNKFDVNAIVRKNYSVLIDSPDGFTGDLPAPYYPSLGLNYYKGIRLNNYWAEATDNDRVYQTAFQTDTFNGKGEMFYRNHINGAWKPWRRMLTEDDIPTASWFYSKTFKFKSRWLTGDIVITQKSGILTMNWGGSFSGGSIGGGDNIILDLSKIGLDRPAQTARGAIFDVSSLSKVGSVNNATPIGSIRWGTDNKINLNMNGDIPAATGADHYWEFGVTAIDNTRPVPEAEPFFQVRTD